MDLLSGRMSSQGSKDDCYFYYYSSCTKGDDCPFRHCKAALGTETVCCLWREGKCFRDNCKFRHMESRINRGTIQCYWEDQPSGCLKPHCVFLHRKPRFNATSVSGSGGLILPVSNTSQGSPSAKVTEVKDVAKHIAVNPVVESYNNISAAELSPTSHPVEPIVVSFDGEESDSESASSTPMKSASDSKYNSSLVKKDLSDNFSDKKDNLGIKTLEQIKMEKIHKESDNFYKSAYDAPYIDTPQVKMSDSSFKTECYPPQSDFVLISDRTTEKTVSANTESSQHSTENESIFKSRLSKRKSIPLYSELSLPPKKMVCLKKSKEDPLDFKIKTLDEIRREKQNKSGNNEEISLQSNSQTGAMIDDSLNKTPSSLNNKPESSNINGKSFRRLKINRQSKEPLTNSNIPQEADSSTENQIKEDRIQMILHEVQNINEDKNKVDIKGKRKDTDTSSESKRAKLFKSDCTSPSSTTLSSTPNDSQNNSVGDEKPTSKLSHPVLKRKKSTTVSLSSKPTSESEISSTVVKSCESSISPPKENNTSLKQHQENNTEDKSLSSNKDADKKISRSSVDELDNFLMDEADVSLDYESDGTLNESEDILLEIEQLLDS